MDIDGEGYLQVNLGLDALLNAYGGGAGGGPAQLGAEAASLLGTDLAERIKAGGQPGGSSLAAGAGLRGAPGGGSISAGVVPADGGYGGEGYGLGVDRDVASELRHHRDEVVRRAVDEAKDAAARASSRHQRQRAAAQWRQERKDLLNSLSVTFSHAAAAEAANAAAPPLALPGSSLRGFGGAAAGASVDEGQLVRVAGGALVPASALPGGADGGGSRPSGVGGASGSQLTAGMKANANVVRRVNGRCLGDAAARSEKVWPCRSFAEVALRSSPAGTSGGSGALGGWGPAHPQFARVTAYLRCWQLVCGATGEASSDTPPLPGQFAALHSLTAAGSGQQRYAAWQMATGSRRAMEVMEHEAGAEEVDKLRARLPPAGVASSAGRGVAADVAFVLTHATSAAAGANSPNGYGSGGGVTAESVGWAQLFTLLRCGDVRGAAELADELSANLRVAHTAEVSHALACLDRLQTAYVAHHQPSPGAAGGAGGAGAGVLGGFGGGISRDLAEEATTKAELSRCAAALAAAQAPIAEAFDAYEADARHADPVLTQYRLAVLNLVAFRRPYQHVACSPLTPSADGPEGGADGMAGNADGVAGLLGTPAVEDWLWQALWFATAAQGQDAASAGGGGGAGTLTLAELQGVVVQHPDKFEDPANPLRYASFLLAVGAFAEAVNLLWQGGCADEALHLALGLHFHGALPVNLAADAGSVSSDGSSQAVPLARYLRAFTSRFAGADYHAAFEYLVHLNLHGEGSGGGGGRGGQDPAQAEQALQALSDAVGELLLSTNCQAALCGYVTRGGGTLQRQQALLYHYLPPNQAQAVVSAAAGQAEQQGLLPQAVDLYRLAGAWAKLLSVVRHALAARLVHASAPDRPQWWALAQDLEATYLTSSSPPGGGGGMASPQAGEVTSLAVRDSICRSPGGEACLQAFQLLLGLYRFTDAAWGGQGFPGNCNWPVALACVDQLGLLPASRPQVGAAVHQTQILVSGGSGGGSGGGLGGGSSSSREPALRPEHVRHLLLGTMRCLHFKQQALREGAAGGAQEARGVAPDAGSLAENIEHAKALMEFASQGQFEHHSSDTMVEMSQMLSGIAY